MCNSKLGLFCPQLGDKQSQYIWMVMGLPKQVQEASEKRMANIPGEILHYSEKLKEDKCEFMEVLHSMAFNAKEWQDVCNEEAADQVLSGIREILKEMKVGDIHSHKCCVHILLI